MMVVIGGLGRFEGPFIGALVVVVLPEVLRASEGLYLIIFAISVIAMMLFMPKGLIGLWDLFLAHVVAPRPAPSADAKPAEEG